MYMDEFINDFTPENYRYFLPNIDSRKKDGTLKTIEEIKQESAPSRQVLAQLADSYANQYRNPTYLEPLAFKESLDHYVLKKIKTDPNFIGSPTFKLYCEYIQHVFLKRQSVGKKRLEFNTNIVMQDPYARQVILATYDEDFRTKAKREIETNEAIISRLHQKMLAGNHLTQQEMNYLGDYLYTRRDPASDIHKDFVEYLINEVPNNSQIVTTPPIIAAYISYLPHFYGDDCEKRRMFYTNGFGNGTGRINAQEIEMIRKLDANKPRWQQRVRNSKAYSAGNINCIAIGDEYCRVDLRSDASLDKSRGFLQQDIYWISMVCFHELTHQYQKKLVYSPEFNSSGFAQIIRRNTPQIDYDQNHNDYEIEIEADERAWDKMKSFIMNFQKNKEKRDQQLKKCQQNQRAVYGRRTFTQKKNSSDASDYFSQDIEIIKNRLKDKRELSRFRKERNQTPMMQMVFTEDGDIKEDIIFNSNITSYDTAGIVPNIAGCELAHYILSKKFSDVKRYILNNNISEKQVLTLMLNIYNTYHIDKTYLNELQQLEKRVAKEKAEKEVQDKKASANDAQVPKKSDNPDKEPDKEDDPYGGQFDETFRKLDKTTIREKFLQRFKRIAAMVYIERSLVANIKAKYPSYDPEKYTGGAKYARWNYYDAFEFLNQNRNGLVEEREVADVIARYTASGDPLLLELAETTKKAVVSGGQASIAPQTQK